MALETEEEQALDMRLYGKMHAALPALDGLLADAKHLSECSLRQAQALAQPRTGAPESVLLLGSVRKHAPHHSSRFFLYGLMT
jgi:hypothetical protein